MKFCNDKPWLDGMKEELDSKLREAKMNELTTAEKLDALIEVLTDIHHSPVQGYRVKELVEQRALANRKREPHVWLEIRDNNNDYIDIFTGGMRGLNQAKSRIQHTDRQIWKFTRYPGKPPVVEIVEDTDHE